MDSFEKQRERQYLQEAREADRYKYEAWLAEKRTTVGKEVGGLATLASGGFIDSEAGTDAYNNPEQQTFETPQEFQRTVGETALAGQVEIVPSQQLQPESLRIDQLTAEEVATGPVQTPEYARN